MKISKRGLEIFLNHEIYETFKHENFVMYSYMYFEVKHRHRV